GSSIQGFAIHKPQAFRGMDFMDLLVVDPSFRRKGIATLLLVHFVENSNTPQSWTSTNRSNGPMISLLRKLNWCESDHIEELDPGDPDLFFFTN
ncbi:MAG TPA: GNAT family N-acetyltransferase, partial [Candidatus Nanopelagicaceae bacterium]